MIPAVRIVLQVHRAAVLHLLGAVAVPALVQAHPAEVDRVLLVAVLHRAAAPAAAPVAVLLILQVPLTDRIGPGAMASSDFPVVNWFCIRLAVARMTMMTRMMILQMMTLLRMMIPVVPHRAVVPAALTAPQALLHPQAAVGAVAAPVLTQVRPAEVAQAHRAAVAVPAVRTVPQAHQMTLPQAPETPVKTARN